LCRVSGPAAVGRSFVKGEEGGINDEGGVTGGENFAWGVAIFHSFSLATAFANAYVEFNKTEVFPLGSMDYFIGYARLCTKMDINRRNPAISAYRRVWHGLVPLHPSLF